MFPSPGPATSLSPSQEGWGARRGPVWFDIPDLPLPFSRGEGSVFAWEFRGRGFHSFLPSSIAKWY